MDFTPKAKKTYRMLKYSGNLKWFLTRFSSEYQGHDELGLIIDPKGLTSHNSRVSEKELQDASEFLMKMMQDFWNNNNYYIPTQGYKIVKDISWLTVTSLDMDVIDERISRILRGQYFLPSLEESMIYTFEELSENQKQEIENLFP